jgi:predicted unusual protein kinase regulating ubiquinone biosynthesis (AarF/ABC1/UbiB family)
MTTLTYSSSIYQAYLMCELSSLFGAIYINKHIIHNENFNDYLIEKIYMSIMHNGCLVIKLTQWMMTKFNMTYRNRLEMEGIASPKWLDMFNDCFENCPVHPMSYTKIVYKRLTGSELSDDYEINNDVLSSGSIGQVYKCFHKKTKKYHAIKVKHPNIQNTVSIPKYTLLFFNYIFKFLPLFKKYVLPIDLNNFFDNLDKQLDFENEVKNINKMKENFKNDYLIVIPQVYNSNRDIIIMSYENAENVDDILTTKQHAIFKIAMTYIMFFHKCCLIKNFNHGDLHKGNWKVRKMDNGIDYQLVLYDFGICYELDEPERIRAYIHSWEKYDIDEVSNIVRMFYNGDDMDEKKIDEAQGQLKKFFLEKGLKPICIHKYVSFVYDITTKYNILIHHSIFNLLISLCLCEELLSKAAIINRDNTPNENNERDIKTDVYQVLYPAYINFCKTKGCFLDLLEYYEHILEKNKDYSNSLFEEIGIKVGKMLGNSKMKLDNSVQMDF